MKRAVIIFSLCAVTTAAEQDLLESWQEFNAAIDSWSHVWNRWALNPGTSPVMEEEKWKELKQAFKNLEQSRSDERKKLGL